jgi:hypothetical protein
MTANLAVIAALFMENHSTGLAGQAELRFRIVDSVEELIFIHIRAFGRIERH